MNPSSASADLQSVVADVLSAQLPAIPLTKRRFKELESDIEAAAKNHGLCLWVMPCFPMSALENVPFVFYDEIEVRVRILEKTAVNKGPEDAYSLNDKVADALQWEPFNTLNAAVKSVMTAQSVDLPTAEGIVLRDPSLQAFVALNAMLSHPLMLKRKPAEMVEDPQIRIVDVLFRAVLQLPPS